MAIQLFLTSLLFGCVTGKVRLPDVEYPLLSIQKAVDANLPFGIRQKSSNGREFSSEYFLARGTDMKKAKNAPLRNYAKVWVLGDRRPYNVDVVVYREQRFVRGGVAEYKIVDSDKDLAQRIAKDILKTLNERREDRNVIDDYRVF